MLLILLTELKKPHNNKQTKKQTKKTHTKKPTQGLFIFLPKHQNNIICLKNDKLIFLPGFEENI